MASVARNFFDGHRKVIRVGSLYADPANIQNAVKKFVHNVGPQSIGMYLTIPSRDILSPKSKYCTGFDVRPHNDWAITLYIKHCDTIQCHKYSTASH